MVGVIMVEAYYPEDNAWDTVYSTDEIRKLEFFDDNPNIMQFLVDKYKDCDSMHIHSVLFWNHSMKYFNVNVILHIFLITFLITIQSWTLLVFPSITLPIMVIIRYTVEVNRGIIVYNRGDVIDIYSYAGLTKMDIPKSSYQRGKERLVLSDNKTFLPNVSEELEKYLFNPRTGQ